MKLYNINIYNYVKYELRKMGTPEKEIPKKTKLVLEATGETGIPEILFLSFLRITKLNENSIGICAKGMANALKNSIEAINSFNETMIKMYIPKDEVKVFKFKAIDIPEMPYQFKNKKNRGKHKKRFLDW